MPDAKSDAEIQSLVSDAIERSAEAKRKAARALSLADDAQDRPLAEKRRLALQAEAFYKEAESQLKDLVDSASALIAPLEGTDSAAVEARAHLWPIIAPVKPAVDTACEEVLDAAEALDQALAGAFDRSTNVDGTAREDLARKLAHVEKVRAELAKRLAAGGRTLG